MPNSTENKESLLMARIGVNYEMIKQAAIQLLAQGIAPSVQKIRERLGTGSHTTIAQHLKVWREEYAHKTIHHLPSHLPKELISAIEVLWQTAMDQASQQLSAVKHNLMEEQEKLRLDRAGMEKTESEWRTRLADTQKTVDEKNAKVQALQIELTITQEKLNQKIEENQSIKSQYESQRQRTEDDKQIEIDKNQQLNRHVNQLKQQLSEQTEKYHNMRNEERTLQEDSEKRWIKLIDAARMEAKNQRKQFEKTIQKQSKKMDTYQTILSEWQHEQITQQSVIAQKNERITEISVQYNQMQEKYQNASATIAVLQERLNQLNNPSKKSKPNQQLKMAKPA